MLDKVSMRFRKLASVVETTCRSVSTGQTKSLTMMRPLRRARSCAAEMIDVVRLAVAIVLITQYISDHNHIVSDSYSLHYRNSV